MLRPDLLIDEQEAPSADKGTRENIRKSLLKTREIALGGTKKDLTAANRANELLGKSIGMFQDVLVKKDDPYAKMRERDLRSSIRAMMKDAVIRNFVREILEEFEREAGSKVDERSGGSGGSGENPSLN